jgi:hypothetical protein
MCDFCAVGTEFSHEFLAEGILKSVSGMTASVSHERVSFSDTFQSNNLLFRE